MSNEKFKGKITSLAGNYCIFFKARNCPKRCGLSNCLVSKSGNPNKLYWNRPVLRLWEDDRIRYYNQHNDYVKHRRQNPNRQRRGRNVIRIPLGGNDQPVILDQPVVVPQNNSQPRRSARIAARERNKKAYNRYGNGFA